jgi:phytoene synthase
MSIATHYPAEAAAPSAYRAGGSSFYLAMRILGRQQRQAMFEVYSFCRAVDDIADSDAPREARLAQLALWRNLIETYYSYRRFGEADDLATAINRFALRKRDFLAVIEGMEMDAAADIRAPDFARLQFYCDRVACAVGRLSVRIFGLEGEAGLHLAHHLGLALQLTNILRDIDEDAAYGRLYLPREALRAAGIEGDDPNAVTADRRLGAACMIVAERARAHFIEADRIMSAAPRHAIRAPKIMEEVYRRLLDDLMVQGWNQPRGRVHVNKPRLIWIALRYGFV